MGTRHLTMVVSDQKVRVAQYGQFDGYPDGQGLTILNFLQKVNLKRFRKRVEAVREITPEETKIAEALHHDELKKRFLHLHRDLGGRILEYIYKNDLSTGLVLYTEFAAHSIFCEWAYVIDLDSQTLEVYKGFNKKPLKETDRFFYLTEISQEKPNGYYPIKMKRKYPLTNLPDKATFLKHFKC